MLFRSITHKNYPKKRNFVNETNNLINALTTCGVSTEDCHFSIMWAFTRIFFLKDELVEYPQGLEIKMLETMMFYIKNTRLNQIGVLNFHVEEKDPILYDVVEVLQAGNVWNFKNSLISRFSNSLSRLFACDKSDYFKGKFKNEDLRILGFWKRMADTLLEKSIKFRGDSFEFLTSWRSAETNTETQPWATLGFFSSYDAYITQALLGKTCNLCDPNQTNQKYQPKETSPVYIILVIIPFGVTLFVLTKYSRFRLIYKKNN